VLGTISAPPLLAGSENQDEYVGAGAYLTVDALRIYPRSLVFDFLFISVNPGQNLRQCATINFYPCFFSSSYHLIGSFQS